jgi:hypothetical protein
MSALPGINGLEMLPKVQPRATMAALIRSPRPRARATTRGSLLVTGWLKSANYRHPENSSEAKRMPFDSL